MREPGAEVFNIQHVLGEVCTVVLKFGLGEGFAVLSGS